MATLSDLIRTHTDLGPDAREHLRRLVGSWGPLADLCFADLLLYSPVADSAEVRLIALDQLRPSTAPTMYHDDQIGRLVPLDERPMIEAAFRTGTIVQEEIFLAEVGTRAKVEAIPVRFDGRIIAVVTRETPRLGHRSLGDLELAYLGVFERLAQMICDGVFPFEHDDPAGEVAPRVGDGALVLDRQASVVYSSPNAVSAFHRLGIHGTVAGRRLDDLGFPAESTRTAFTLETPVVEELSRGDSVTILARIIPLLTAGTVDGALVLMRDVSELRRRERLLVSMDATIREIHHRVKNNLQTVVSLLRLQARRVEAAEARTAIEEAERRIATIAVVHEMLSRGGGDEVVFGEVVRPILAMAEASGRARVRLVGEGPVVSTTVASSLAVVVNELVQNAVEHGYPPGSDPGTVTVELIYTPSELAISVHDDGVGLPADFDLRHSTGLGLTIISTLVETEFRGTLAIRPATPPGPGTVAQLTVGLTPR